MEFPEINLLQEREALLYSTSYEEPKLHVSFMDDKGQVLAVEWIEHNYPSFSLFTFKTIHQYADIINSVPWIIDKENIKKIKEEIEVLIKFED